MPKPCNKNCSAFDGMGIKQFDGMAAHQASSSSSSGSSYEVFLSFHGKDVRTNFADHLYNALVSAEIRIFRDDEELPKGNEIGPKLFEAIQKSRISIPIFSRNYASSRWCLDELAQISECKRKMDQIVLPIFYKVKPSDVQDYQTGTYAEAFEKHRKRFNEETMQEWKNALKEVGELDGLHWEEGTYEGKLIKEVVKKVWSALNKKPFIVPNILVGIQSHIRQVLMLLDIESDNRKIVGIHGIGGVGKTTIAKIVYNTVLHHFEGYSFIENIQENAQIHGLPHLQKQLISDILKQECRYITSVDDGINVIRQRFCQRKVLIVLDDVDQGCQAKSLVGDPEWFGIGSKIIITSRNEDILIGQKADGIYKPNILNFDDSLELFSHHAFGKDRPPKDYLDLSKAMVKTTGGLPLAVQVVGSSSSYLNGKSRWEKMLEKLQKISSNDVMERLKITYESLDHEVQQMFLDTACFFIGMEKDFACFVWDGCGFSSEAGLDALCVRSLVKINEKGVLRMHDQLRDLGRLIVRQESMDDPGERSRIWSQEDVLEIIDTQMGTNKIKGLSIDFRDKSMSQCLMSEGFSTMKRLRLLQVDYAHFSGNLLIHSFSQLRWLSWKGCPDLQSAQTNFCPRNLAVLDLSYGEITENWMGWNCIKMAVNLKVLNLMSCSQLYRSPDLSANRRLEVLNLADSVSLVEIDKSIGFLCNLVIFDMSGCVRLVDLPIEICGLTALKTLALARCKSLLELPNEICQLTSLEMLNLRECEKLLHISNLPLSLTSLDVTDCNSVQYISGRPISGLPSSSTLKAVDLTGCKNLVELPIGICQMTSLESLNLWECTKLLRISNLPLSLISLNVKHCSSIRYISGLPSSLTSLHVECCESLETLSSTLGLKNLEILSVFSCYRLKEIEGVDGGLDSLVLFGLAGNSLRKLPNLSNSKKLRTLAIVDCLELRDIEGLEDCESLQILQIHYWMKRLADLSNLNKLQVLEIVACGEITTIPGLDRLVSLEKLRIVQCKDIQKLPDLSNLKNLTELKIENCNKLTEIHAFGRLEFLVKLDIGRCDSLERTPDLSNLKNLNDLEIMGCPSLTEILGVDKLESLQTLNITGCRSLESLPDLSNLKKLKCLKAKACTKLTEIHCVGRMEFFVELHIDWCESLERLPDLRNFNNLKELRANDCKKLSEIHGLDGLEFLKWLDVSGCESLERLPDLSNLKDLNDLQITGCPKLIEIHALGRWEFVEKLNIEGCESLESLPGVSNLINLKELRANGCKKLTKIDGVDRLKFLKILDISGCESLERLPDLSNLRRLTELRAYGCRKLIEIQAGDGLESLEVLDIRGCLSLQKLPVITRRTLVL